MIPETAPTTIAYGLATVVALITAFSITALPALTLVYGRPETEHELSRTGSGYRLVDDGKPHLHLRHIGAAIIDICVAVVIFILLCAVLYGIGAVTQMLM